MSGSPWLHLADTQLEPIHGHDLAIKMIISGALAWQRIWKIEAKTVESII
ncbi:hypothetical protein JCM19241_2410 [Vibrio ishigakensis]|uniref:Uncharacterized protein n=1 Tax=Vibrio ishigakensis TaxID=1481914 RepID=A0A0B8Q0E5_9VIBR|nr:hypothetical protein JCM19241_2410 [Vibrio ishigakensis]